MENTTTMGCNARKTNNETNICMKMEKVLVNPAGIALKKMLIILGNVHIFKSSKHRVP
jgi:hypothetical protein